MACLMHYILPFLEIVLLSFQCSSFSAVTKQNNQHKQCPSMLVFQRK